MTLICGIDEAGRGPLAGPVYAAAVIFDSNFFIDGLNDSKKLSEKKRLDLCEMIKINALDYSFSFASVSEIDHLNILQASLLAMKRAYEKLTKLPDQIIIDGNFIPNIDFNNIKSLPKADELIPAVSAASIIAKIERDNYMKELDLKYPEYNLKKHKGYPTKEHIDLIRIHGVKDFYRKSFKPVRDLIN
jgi:ribonuclease HII